jgi:hypothetical protein
MEAFFTAVQADERTQVAYAPASTFVSGSSLTSTGSESPLVWRRRDEDADDLSGLRARERRLRASHAQHDTSSVPVIKQFSYSTVMVEKAVAKQVEAAIHEAVDKQGNQQIQYSIIDDILSLHAKKQKTGVVGLYVLSTKPPSTSYQYGYTSSKLINSCTSAVQVGKV